MASYSDLVVNISQAAYFALVMARHAANQVPVETWLSPVNVGLSLSQYAGELFAQLRALLTGIFRAFFLEEWPGLLDDAVDDADRAAINARFTDVARNFYGIARGEAQFQLARFLLTADPGAPTQTVSAGFLVGTPGASGLLWAAEDSGVVEPGQRMIFEFRALEPGTAYNVPIGSSLELKTSLLGVALTNPASGPATLLGGGASGLVLFAKRAGVTIEVVNLGANQLLTVSGNLGTGRITVSLATDNVGTALSSAEDARKALQTAVTATGVPQLLLCARNQTTGSGVMAVTAAPVALAWDGSYITEAGADEEPMQRLKRRCETRLDTLGGGGRDGAPTGENGTEDALVFWGLAIPAGYKASPVRWVRVLSNNHLGTMSGAESTIVLAGAAGAVSSSDVTAVASNYENPKKYWGDINVVSAINHVIALTGTVYVRAASGKSLADAALEVEQSLADFIQILGEEWSKNLAPVVQPQKIGARIEDGDKVAIDHVNLMAPASPVVLAWNEFPAFDASGLTYVFV